MSNHLTNLLQLTRQRTLKPQPKLSLVEWADAHRVLSPESSSMPGKYKSHRVAAAIGPMMAVTDPTVKKITVMGPTQLLKTELLNNIIGYFMHQDPAPIILMQPTQGMAETFSKDRLDKMLRDTPVLRDMVAAKKSRDSGNTILHKSFAGGHITMVGANSPTELASRPVRITLRDEIDKYPDSAGEEGDPSSLIIKRSATFWNSLDVGVCSPTVKGKSKIEKEYLLSDRRKFHVACPQCDHFHVMEWSNVKWVNHDPETTQYQCPECTVLWTERERLDAIQASALRHDYGYVATAPFKGHAGFHVNALASPWNPLSFIVKEWLASKDDLQTLKTFINTQLAETWEEKGEAPEYMRLYERRALYPINTCPDGVVFLTAGCDVQKDRLEVEIVGWAKGKQSYSVDYRVIMGETTTAAPWLELDKLLNETWILQSGHEVQIRVLAVDSGYNTQEVYNWARKYPQNRVMVVKGQDAQQNILGIPTAADVTHAGSKVKRGVRVWPVGVSTLKTELYGWLNLNGAGDDGVYPPGYCHFPQYDEQYFKMLTAEQLMKRKNKKGQTVYEWVKTYERNEALDCRNYARAAAAMLGMDRFKDEDWELDGAVVQRPKSNITQSTQNATPTAYMRPSNSPATHSYWNKSDRKSFWK